MMGHDLQAAAAADNHDIGSAAGWAAVLRMGEASFTVNVSRATLRPRAA
jgi:hypothetical protein